MITNASELQAMEDDLDAAYRLGNDINASETAEWHRGEGFDPIGTYDFGNPSTQFSGTFDGAGHSITGLTIEQPDTEDVGLFGFVNESGRINDLRLRNVSITGSGLVGGLVGLNVGTMWNASTSGRVNGSDWVGGLVGQNDGTVRNASASATVTGSIGVGGLVGFNFEGGVRNASASGSVNGSRFVGGLVGFNFEGTVRNASASGPVTGSNYVGGLVGLNGGTVRNAFATGAVDGSDDVGGLVGDNGGPVTESYWDIDTTGQPTSDGGTGLTTAQMTGDAARTNMTGLAFGTIWQTQPDDYPVLTALPGGIESPSDGGPNEGDTDTSLVDIDPTALPGNGTPGDPYIITNASELQAMEDDLDAAYRLGNDIDASETAEWNGGDGFDPVGPGEDQRFTGTFDGAGHSITGLTIERSDTDYVGLFGYIISGQISDLQLRNVSITGSEIVGGLVEGNFEGTVRNASASGTVTGSEEVGGLVGANFGTVRNASASGTVTGSEEVGGLVGANFGTVRNASASGSVTGTGLGSVGGLVGDNPGTVRNASASGPVNGSRYVGGLVGFNDGGTVRNASTSGTVTGSTWVGGLVGGHSGTVRDASASGTVTGSTRVGGLVGFNSHDSTVRSASASGSVNGSTRVGGLVGANLGTVRNASASGSVTGSGDVGGLVGINSVESNDDGTVRNAFATGAVNGSYRVGGLVGDNDDGVVIESYWDVDTTGQPTSDGGTGLTTAQMTGDAARTNMTGLAFGTVWQTRPNEYPMLNTQPTDPNEPPQAPITVSSGTPPATEGPDQSPTTEGPDQSGIGGISPMFAIGAILIIGLGGGMWLIRRDGDQEEHPDTPATPGDGSSPTPSASDDVTEQLQAHPIPDEIPGVGAVSVEYDALTDRESIGSGGNADVTKATHPGPDGDLTLAIKEPRMAGTLHTEQIKGMLKEAETWDRLDGHAHIVGLVDYGSEPIPWIAMEYMDGGHLGDRGEEMETSQALWTALAITKGVVHAHQRGVAHLDLKPENVLFRTVADGWDVPKVADWGVSKYLLEHSSSVEGVTPSVEGLPPQYAAPEQFDDSFGKTDDITDVYQLGAVFYELFTGQAPFEGPPATVMGEIFDDPPTPPSEVADLPDQLDEILLTALAKEKDQRYENSILLRDALQDLYDEW